MKFLLPLFFAILLMAQAYAAEAAACQIQQTSSGDFGIREYRASGWVYLVRGLSYEEAVRALENLQATGRCE